MSQQATIAFADAAAEVAGVAIAGVGTLLWLGGEISAAAPAQLAGTAPAWTLAAAGALSLELTSAGDPASLTGGMSIWLCRASGRVAERAVDALATLTVAPAAAELPLERSASITLERELAFALVAAGPRGGGHGDERLEAAVWRGDPAVATAIARPRLSTTYDGVGIARHAGIELWEDEESEYSMRIGGEALANGEIVHPGGRSSRVVFMAWHHEDHRALGSYTITSTPPS